MNFVWKACWNPHLDMRPQCRVGQFQLLRGIVTRSPGSQPRACHPRGTYTMSVPRTSRVFPWEGLKVGNLGQLHPVADMIYYWITLLTEMLTNDMVAVTVKWNSVTWRNSPEYLTYTGWKEDQSRMGNRLELFIVLNRRYLNFGSSGVFVLHMSRASRVTFGPSGLRAPEVQTMLNHY